MNPEQLIHLIAAYMRANNLTVFRVSEESITEVMLSGDELVATRDDTNDDIVITRRPGTILGEVLDEG